MSPRPRSIRHLWAVRIGCGLAGLCALFHCAGDEHARTDGARDVVRVDTEAASDEETTELDEPADGEAIEARRAAIKAAFTPQAGGGPPNEADDDTVECQELSSRAGQALQEARNAAVQCEQDADCRPFFTLELTEGLRVCWQQCGWDERGSGQYQDAIRQAFSTGETRSACEEFWTRGCTSMTLPCVPPPPQAPVTWQCFDQHCEPRPG